MLAPIEMIRAVLDGMVERRFGRIVNITSAMVKAPQAPMGLSAGARAGLTSACKALSQQVAWANVTINNLLPERIYTDRQAQMAQLTAALNNISVEEAYDQMRARIPAGRLGRPDELGDVRVSLQQARRVHHRTESAARRRSVCGDDMSKEFTAETRRGGEMRSCSLQPAHTQPRQQ